MGTKKHTKQNTHIEDTQWHRASTQQVQGVRPYFTNYQLLDQWEKKFI